jgi:hypothetical protein
MSRAEQRPDGQGGPIEGYVRDPPPDLRAPPDQARLRLYMISVATTIRPPGHGHVRRLRPVRSGRAYLLTCPAARRLVAPPLAEALEAVFERFARQVGAGESDPLEVGIARGFVPGSPGHGEGRAADIATVGGRTLLDWKWDWDRAMALAERLTDPRQRADARAGERRRNLGHGLYQALLRRCGWRIDDHGWRPYRRVEQLFGPWTATEGPWRTIQVAEPTPTQQRRLADQRWVFAAHQDHIHVAR